MFKKINKNEIFKKGIGAGAAQIAYIILVVLLILSLDRFMNDSAGGPLAMVLVLTLLVFSAAVSGLLVFGYPALFALQRKFNEAIMTLLVTLLTILACFIVVLLVIFLV
jgi:hypothetical protein